MTESFTNLYKHGQRLNTLCKKFFTEFKKAEETDNSDLMIIYGEALRKSTMNTVEIAKCVLGVEEIVKGAKRDYNKTHEIPYDPSEKYRTNPENS